MGKITDEMFNNAKNKRNKQKLKIERLLAKYAPKPVRTYKENGLKITVYEARNGG